jgi:hypothetical protein
MRRVQRVGERFGKSAKKALLFEKRSKNFFSWRVRWVGDHRCERKRKARRSAGPLL